MKLKVLNKVYIIVTLQEFKTTNWIISVARNYLYQAIKYSIGESPLVFRGTDDESVHAPIICYHNDPQILDRQI